MWTLIWRIGLALPARCVCWPQCVCWKRWDVGVANEDWGRGGRMKAGRSQDSRQQMPERAAGPSKSGTGRRGRSPFGPKRQKEGERVGVDSRSFVGLGSRICGWDRAFNLGAKFLTVDTNLLVFVDFGEIGLVFIASWSYVWAGYHAKTSVEAARQIKQEWLLDFTDRIWIVSESFCQGSLNTSFCIVALPDWKSVWDWVKRRALLPSKGNNNEWPARRLLTPPKKDYGIS